MILNKNKSIGLFLVILITSIRGYTQYAAPSQHMGAQFTSDAIVKMGKIKITQSGTSEYFEVLSNSAGGGGYAGLQQTTDLSWVGIPNISINSQWNPASADYISPGTFSSGFGGEGTGAKTINPYAWQLNTWYNFIYRAWKQNGQLLIGHFIQNMNTGIWKQISTLSIPDPNTFLGSYTDSFLENWTGNDPINDGKVERTAYFKDYWILNANNIWEKTTHVTFTVNTSAADEARNGIYNWAFNAGYDATQDAYFMQHGGNITPNTSFGGARTLSLPPQTNQGNSPALTTGTIQSVLAVYTNGQITVNWTNDQTKSPQLSSTVEIINSSGSVINTISEIRPEKRQAVIASSLPNGNYTARVTITDIFNQTSPSVQTSFSSGNAPIQTITITTNGPTTFCEGSSVVLTASVANSYLWNDGETTQSIKVTSSGNYFVTVTNSDRSTSISTPTRVIVNPLPSTPTISVNGAVLTSSATDGNQWYLNGTAISDASSQNYTMETLGSYTLVVTNDSGCSTSSSSYDNTDDDISIHPNPNNGLFRIEKPATMQIVEIKIYDIFGHFIYQSKTGEMNFNLQGKHTGAGIYILEVKTGPRTYKTKKFILQEP